MRQVTSIILMKTAAKPTTNQTGGVGEGERAMPAMATIATTMKTRLMTLRVLRCFPGDFSVGDSMSFLGKCEIFLRKEKGLERNKRLSVKLFQYFNDFVGVWNDASESAVVFHRHSSFHGIANVIDHLSGIDFYNQDSFQFF